MATPAAGRAARLPGLPLGSRSTESTAVSDVVKVDFGTVTVPESTFTKRNRRKPPHRWIHP